MLVVPHPVSREEPCAPPRPGLPFTDIQGIAMKLRSLLLLALAVSACNGTNPALPVSPSALAEAPLLPTGPSSAAAPMAMEMGAGPGEVSAEADFDSIFSAEQDVDGPALEITGLDVSAAAGAPGRPVLTAVAKGNSVALSWKRAATGGAPKAYFVVYKGLTKPMGLSTSFSFTASPGRYLVVVYAKNDAGTGAPATAEVSVGSGRSVYKGSFVQTGTIIQNFAAATCRWSLTYRGTVELTTDYSSKAGLTGSMRLVGTASTPRGLSSSPNFTCYPGTAPFADTKPVIISGTNIARSGLFMGYSTGTFSGNLSGSTVAGKIIAVYKYGFGTLTIPVVLKK
jgi:hypothetical protein